MLSNEIIHFFLNCKFRAYQQYKGFNGKIHGYETLQNDLLDIYQKRYYKQLQTSKIPILDSLGSKKKLNFEKKAIVKEVIFKSEKNSTIS